MRDEVLRSSDSVQLWLSICAAIALAFGLLGWTIGAHWHKAPATETVSTVSKAPRVARVAAADVTNTPFGAINDAVGPSLPASRAPALPFAVLRAWSEQGLPMVLLVRDGQHFVARGFAVHGDYLIEVGSNRIVFTYLPSAARQSLAIPAGSVGDSDSFATTSRAWRVAPLRNPAGDSMAFSTAPQSTAEEEAERD